MKVFSYFLLVLFLSGFALSCKKGKDDPLISFRTRKNRLTGNWRIKSGRTIYTESNSSGMTTTSEGFDYTETGYSYLSGIGPGAVFYKGGHSYNLKFDKYGYMTSSEMFDGYEDAYTGSWDFNTGVGSAKGKEKINIHYQSLHNNNGIKSYSGNQTDIVFSIIELRNSKLRIEAKDERVNADGSGYKYYEYYELVQD